MAPRRVPAAAAAALLLAAVVVHVSVHRGDNTGYSARPEPATLLAAVKTAEATSKVLQAKLASVDVGGSLSPAVVQKLAGAVVSVPKGKKRAPMDQSDVVKAAEDITKVIKDGKQDDASVKSVLSESKTHGGKDSGSASLFKELHEQAAALKRKSKVSLSADISSALDVSKAHSKKQLKMAQTEALTIEKVLQQSKQDLGVGKIIQKHSKSTGGTKDWDNFWGSKHSLVSRLAAQVDAAAAKNPTHAAKGAAVKGGKGGKGSAAAAASKKAALAASKAHEEMLKKVPAAIRNMWSLLKAAKADKH